MLVVNDQQQHLVPLRTRSQGLVNLLDEPLPLGHIVDGVVVVGGDVEQVEVAGLNDGVIRELAPPGVVLEREVEGAEVVDVLELAEVAVEEGVGHLLVVDPEREPGFFHGFEDGFLRQARLEHLLVVAHEPVRGRGVQVLPVGLRAGRHRREPAVHHGELLD